MDYFKAPGIFVDTSSSVDSQGISPLSMNSNLVGFVGIAERGQVHVPTYIRNFKEYQKYFGGYDTVGMLPYCVESFFNNGGEQCIVLRIAKRDVVKESALNIKATGGELNIKTTSPGEWGNSIHLSLWKENEKSFSISLKYRDQVENYLHLSYNKNDERYFEKFINDRSKWCRLETKGEITQFNPILLTRFNGGNDGLDNLTPRDFLGQYVNPNDNWGIASFERYDDMTLVAIPDVQILKKMDDILTVQKVTTMFADQRKDRTVVLDVPERLVFQDIKRWSQAINTRTSAGYYPNIMVPKKSTGAKDGEKISIPPCGAVCGIISRTDRLYGPYMPPSGTVISGTENTSKKFNLSEQEILFSANINYLKYIRGNGVRIWGARTLDVNPASEWKYLNVRRAFSRICKFLKHNTEWAVFEPNTAETRKNIVYSVQSYLMDLFRKGYFVGKNTDEAFYVYCGEENNPPEQLDKGIITIDVGVALVKPAEFFNIRFSSNKESGSVDFAGPVQAN